jgi:hypothetical protein
MGWAGNVARTGYMRNSYKTLVGTHEGKIPVPRYKHRWEFNMVNLKAIRYENMDWIHLAQDRGQCRALAQTVVNLLIP